jgi:hypothetical protein
MASLSSAKRSRALRVVDNMVPKLLNERSCRMYRTSLIKSGQMYVQSGKDSSANGGTVAGAVRFPDAICNGNAGANGYDYYSGDVAAVRSLATRKLGLWP